MYKVIPIFLTILFLFNYTFEKKLKVNIDKIYSNKKSKNDINELPEELENFDSSSRSTSVYNIGQNLPYSVDYSSSNLLRFVKKGDILYDPVGSFIPVVYGATGHTAIVEGIFFDDTFQQFYIRTIESNLDCGVARGLLSPERFENGMTIYRVHNATENQIDIAVNFAINQLGESYDTNLLLGNVDINSDKWYCSELVWAAYKSADIELDLRTNKNGLLSPHVLVDTYLLGKIMKDECATEFYINDILHIYYCDNDSFSEPHDRNEKNGEFDKCSVCGHIFYPNC